MSSVSIQGTFASDSHLHGHQEEQVESETEMLLHADQMLLPPALGFAELFPVL